MRLEMGTFPVQKITFGSQMRYQDGHLEVDKAAVLAAVQHDPRIATADLEIASPGESVRIWPVRDVIEPRCKVEGLIVGLLRRLQLLVNVVLPPWDAVGAVELHSNWLTRHQERRSAY